MATRQDIELRLPRILFLDGCFATIYRGGIPTGTPETKELILLPNSPSIRAGGIAKDMTTLNEPSPVLSIHNNRVYRQPYNTNLLLPLSPHNTEWNIWLGLCNIKGQPIGVGSKQFQPFTSLASRVDAYQEQIKNMDLEIARLREKNRDLIIKTSKTLREEFGMVDSRMRRAMPHELLETEFGKKEER